MTVKRVTPEYYTMSQTNGNMESTQFLIVICHLEIKGSYCKKCGIRFQHN